MTSLVQVGIRDLCEQEFDTARDDPRVRMITDLDLAEARHDSRTRALARETIAGCRNWCTSPSTSTPSIRPCPGRAHRSGRTRLGRDHDLARQAAKSGSAWCRWI